MNRLSHGHGIPTLSHDASDLPPLELVSWGCAGRCFFTAMKISNLAKIVVLIKQDLEAVLQ
jgi:hypothetical protein